MHRKTDMARAASPGLLKGLALLLPSTPRSGDWVANHVVGIEEARLLAEAHLGRDGRADAACPGTVRVVGHLTAATALHTADREVAVARRRSFLMYGLCVMAAIASWLYPGICDDPGLPHDLS